MSTTENETRTSFPAGFIAGALGYLIGALFHKPWLSYLLFFLLAYFGYDFRRVIQVTRESIARALKIPDDVRYVYGRAKWFNPIPILSLIPGTFLAFGYWGMSNGRSTDDPFYCLFHIPEAIQANWTWMTTSINPLSDLWNRPTDPVFLCFGTGLFAFVLAMILGWFTVTGLIWSVQSLWKNSKEIPRYVYYSVFYLTVGLLIGTIQCLVFILIEIHTVRRAACGLAALASGAAYLFFVPFSIEHVSLALTALGCGLACGGASWLATWALDGEPTLAKFKAFVDRTVYSYSPFYKE